MAATVTTARERKNRATAASSQPVAPLGRWRAAPGEGGMVTGRVALLAVAAALALPGVAWGHATVTETSPAQGAALQSQPRQVVFRFSENVETRFGAVRVFDREGERVDTGGPPSRPPRARPRSSSAACRGPLHRHLPGGVGRLAPGRGRLHVHRGAVGRPVGGRGGQPDRRRRSGPGRSHRLLRGQGRGLRRHSAAGRRRDLPLAGLVAGRAPGGRSAGALARRVHRRCGARTRDRAGHRRRRRGAVRGWHRAAGRGGRRNIARRCPGPIGGARRPGHRLRHRLGGPAGRIRGAGARAVAAACPTACAGAAARLGRRHRPGAEPCAPAGDRLGSPGRGGAGDHAGLRGPRQRHRPEGADAAHRRRPRGRHERVGGRGRVPRAGCSRCHPPARAGRAHAAPGRRGGPLLHRRAGGGGRSGGHWRAAVDRAPAVVRRPALDRLRPGDPDQVRAGHGAGGGRRREPPAHAAAAAPLGGGPTRRPGARG